MRCGGEREKKKKWGGGTRVLCRLPSTPTYSPVGCEAKGAVVGFTAPTTPRPPCFSCKVTARVIPWEPQLPPTAAADPLACQGVVVAGPACRHVPSRGWVGRLARPLVATWRARSGWRPGSLACTPLSSRQGIRKYFLDESKLGDSDSYQSARQSQAESPPQVLGE